MAGQSSRPDRRRCSGRITNAGPQAWLPGLSKNFAALQTVGQSGKKALVRRRFPRDDDVVLRKPLPGVARALIEDIERERQGLERCPANRQERRPSIARDAAVQVAW